jgi:hypothetical protein
LKITVGTTVAVGGVVASAALVASGATVAVAGAATGGWVASRATVAVAGAAAGGWVATGAAVGCAGAQAAISMLSKTNTLTTKKVDLRILHLLLLGLKGLTFEKLPVNPPGLMCKHRFECLTGRVIRLPYAW